MQKIDNIDNGKAFDWGKTSEDYRKYRDIYPKSYFDNLKSLGYASSPQSILDLATGTGVLPRGIYSPELRITAVDIAANQIKAAREISQSNNMDISYRVAPADHTGLPSQSFDYISAAQCFVYFDMPKLMKEVDRLLKDQGRFIITWFAWIPGESPIARDSEELVLKYNPDWKGAGYTRLKVDPDHLMEYGFEMDSEFSYDEDIPFTRESWAGRMRALRGIGASLDQESQDKFNKEHLEMLSAKYPASFQIPHHVLINSYKKIDQSPNNS